MKSNDKTLIIIDNDHSLADKTCMYFIAETLFTKEEYEYFCNENKKDKNWVESFYRFYKMLKRKNITLDKLKETIEKIELTKGMKELFEFIRKNKNKFNVIIASASNLFTIKTLIKYNKIDDVIDEIKTLDAIPSEEYLIKVTQKKFHNCPFCNPAQCKKEEFLDYEKENGTFKYHVYICDGLNDFCLTKILGKNDFVCVRKDYDLYKKLCVEKKDKVDCNIFTWSNAEEIIEILKKFY